MEMLEWDRVVATIALGIAAVAGTWVLLLGLRAMYSRPWFSFRRAGISHESTPKPPKGISAW